MGALRWVENEINAQQEGHNAALRERLKSSPIPLPPEVFDELIHLNTLHLNEVMRVHPAFKIWDRQGSYKVSLNVFERAARDFLNAIARFEAHAEGDSDVFKRANQEKLQDIEETIQKELFAVTNAAASLVEHARRLQSEVNVPNFDTCFLGIFGLRTAMKATVEQPALPIAFYNRK
jgi:hypothetical protein